MPLIKRYVALIGLPLVGVTTAARLIAPVLRLQHIHAGHMLRNYDFDTVEYSQPLLDYALLGTNPGDSGAIVQIAIDRLEHSLLLKGAVLDGIPSNVHQAVLLDDYLRHKKNNLFNVVYLKIPTEDESLLFERAKHRLECLNCGWTYGKHSHVIPLKEGICDNCKGELSSDPQTTVAVARARIKWFKQGINSILDYYRKDDRVPLIEWDIWARNSPLQVAYGLAQRFALPIVRVTSRRPVLGPPSPLQLKLPLNTNPTDMVMQKK